MFMPMVLLSLRYCYCYRPNESNLRAVFSPVPRGSGKDERVRNSIYRKLYNIRRTKSQNLNVSRLGLQLSLRNILKPSVTLRREWRCGWSSADRRYSNYIRVVNNLLKLHGNVFFVLARYKKIVTISCVQWLKNCSLKCVESVFIWRYLYSNFVYDSRFYSNAVFYSRFMPCLCAGRVPVRTTAVRTPQDAVSWIPYPREGAYSAAISLNISLTIESWRMRLSSSNYWWCVHANFI